NIQFVFGLGSVAQVVTGNVFFGDYFSINVGFGLGVLCTMFYSITGFHMNAAVSFTMSVFGRLHWKMLPLCFLLFVLSVGMLYIITVGAISLSGPKTTAGIFATYTAPYISIYTGFFDQLIQTIMGLRDRCMFQGAHFPAWCSRQA
uniref:Uncharacterized protein n=1 Tax=Sinocyclocheilus rhinocerous TaxID=307959 RepID=A0A673FNB6_9TELE